jgi:hypothetical protein
MPQSPLDDVQKQVKQVGNDLSDAFSFKNPRQKIWEGVRNMYGRAPKPAPVQAAESSGARKISTPSTGLKAVVPGAKTVVKTPIIKNQGLKR